MKTELWGKPLFRLTFEAKFAPWYWRVRFYRDQCIILNLGCLVLKLWWGSRKESVV